MEKQRMALNVFFIALALFVAQALGAAHIYAVTWDETNNQWKLDDVNVQVITLSASVAYIFDIPSSAGGKFFLSSSDNSNDTTSALAASDGCTNNLCTPPCQITYVPLASDSGQTFYYISDTVQNAGSSLIITTCSLVAGEIDCAKVAGCGWTTACVECSSLNTEKLCSKAATCGWCLEGVEDTCLADGDKTCSMFKKSGPKETKKALLLLLLLIIPAGAAIAAIVSLVVKKAEYKKKNEAMFKIEDEMSVLGGRPAPDDNTL